jgi:autotransporter adhesin
VGSERQITNVAAGSAPTDAVNLSQLQAVAALVPTDAVQYDGPAHDVVTLDGLAGTTITNVADGALNATSSDAVNGSQLYATNQQVSINSLAIANLQTDLGDLQVQVNNIASGGAGPVQYSDSGTPTVPNGGIASNDVTLVGAAPGAVAVHNVADGAVAAGSTDAVNGGQLFITNQAVAAAQADADAAQATADDALDLASNSVQYDDPGHTSVTFGPGNPPVAVHNVAAGTAATDAVNVAQLNNAMNTAMTNAVAQANAYTDSRIEALDFDIRDAKREARAGTAAALAAAAMPQPMEAGRTMISGGVGHYRGRSALAIGASHALSNGKSVFKLGITYDASEKVGANAGFGVQF